MGFETGLQISSIWEKHEEVEAAEPSQIPQCSCLEEDKEHILRCPAVLAVAQWTQVLMELDNWMLAANTHSQLQQDIISGLQHWHDEVMDQQVPMEGSNAQVIQDSIGWKVALEGCIAIHWHEEKDQYLKAFKFRKSSKPWTTALITRL